MPPSSAENSADLTPAPRRQDHTSSPSASVPFVKDTFASTASRSAPVTIAIRPSSGARQRGYRTDLGIRKSRIFLQGGLDRKIRSLPVGQISLNWFRKFAVARERGRPVGLRSADGTKPAEVVVSNAVNERSCHSSAMRGGIHAGISKFPNGIGDAIHTKLICPHLS